MAVTRNDKADPQTNRDGSTMYAVEHVAQETGHAVETLQAAPGLAYINHNGSTWTKAAEGSYWLRAKNPVDDPLVPVPAQPEMGSAAGPGEQTAGVTVEEEGMEEDGADEPQIHLPTIMLPAMPFDPVTVGQDTFAPDMTPKTVMPLVCTCNTPQPGIHAMDCAVNKAPVQDTQDRSDGLTHQSRIDQMDPEYMNVPFTKTPEGYLKGRAIVTNIGVFTYKNATGVQAELRLPEEVFALDSLESLKLKPLTNNHPPVNVTAENIKQYQVGNTDTDPSSNTDTYDWNGKSIPQEDRTDGLHVAIGLVVQEAKAVADVEGGKVALSCGYTCDLEPAPAGSKYLGVPYDYIQRNIRYNHVALVDRARAGDEARIRLDSADATLGIQVMSMKFNKEEPMLKKVNLDGVDYEAEAKVIEVYTQTKTRADAADAKVTELTTQVSTLSAERDTHKDKADALAKEVEALKADSMDDAKLEATIAAKLALRETARKLGVEKVDGVSDLELKKSVIMKVTPAAKLDGKDDVYIQSRFDASLEMVVDAANAETQTLLGGGSLPGADKKDSGLSPSEEARQRHHEEQRNRWKTDKGGK